MCGYGLTCANIICILPGREFLNQVVGLRRWGGNIRRGEVDQYTHGSLQEDGKSRPAAGELIYAN